MTKRNGENKDNNKMNLLLRKYTQVMAILMSIFHLYTAGTIPFDVFVQRSIHLMFVFSMIFLLHPWNKKKISWIDIILTILGMLSCIYIFVNYTSISIQSGLSIGIQYLIGIVAVLLILEACRRAIGIAFRLCHNYLFRL